MLLVPISAARNGVASRRAEQGRRSIGCLRGAGEDRAIRIAGAGSRLVPSREDEFSEGPAHTCRRPCLRAGLLAEDGRFEAERPIAWRAAGHSPSGRPSHPAQAEQWPSRTTSVHHSGASAAESHRLPSVARGVRNGLRSRPEVAWKITAERRNASAPRGCRGRREGVTLSAAGRAKSRRRTT